ncbi:MAG: hypothetical protein Q8M95_14365 [Candidatus Methanoperedens sp.]|nr:hypothetical protein [Candidatus Methanoperedens sp.]
MKTAIHIEGKTLNNPTRKTISGILRRTSVEYEMSRYLIKSRLEPSIIEALRTHGRYQTRNGAVLTLRNNRAYLTLRGKIGSLRDMNRLEKVMEDSKYEAILHYPTYPENIKKIEMFNKMLGKVWKKN